MRVMLALIREICELFLWQGLEGVGPRREIFERSEMFGRRQRGVW